MATKSRSRDNFSQAVLKILYRRAGGTCCRCGAATFGPVKNKPLQTVNIGKGAHIAAAASGGPRYDPKMSAEERSGATNGMWLCSNCHDTIDRDPVTYPTATLREMKKDAEDRVRQQLGVATIQPSTGRSTTSNLTTGISAAAILEIRKAKARFLELCSQEEDEGGAGMALKDVGFLDFEQDDYTKEVVAEVLLLLREVVAHCQVAVIGMEVIRRLKSIADQFSSTWEEDEVKLVCEIVEKAIRSPHRRRSNLYQSGMAMLKDVSMYKTLKENKLYKVPLGTIKKLRGGKEETDDPSINAPPSKRPCDDDDQYHQLMESLATSTDPEQIHNLESQIEEIGYEPRIQ